MISRLTRISARAGAAALAALLGVTGTAAASTHHGASSHARKGGTLQVLAVGAQWPGLDPATNTQDAADSNYMNAIYGQLFEAGPKGTVRPDLATGYSFSNHNLTVTIHLRHGVVFQDGTPYTAQAVASSISRDLLPANACICLSVFKPVSSVTSSGRYNVVVHLSRPYSAIITAFVGTAPNWTVSPTALSKDGESAFAQHPIGAGPFEVVSNSASATLRLKAYPKYWQKGHPLLAGIVVTSVGTDQSALSSLQAGQTQLVLGPTTIPLIQQAKSYAKVYVLPATFYEFVSLNDTKPPFNNINARRALYYATDPKSLVSALYANLYKVTQGPTAPGEPFYYTKVPGYPTYNLAKASSLVSSIGGLSVTLATTSNTAYWVNEAQALATMWGRAGIKVNISVNTLQNTLQQLETNNWQALLSNWGGVDPAVALPTYFASSGPFTGIHDPTLDGLINQGAAYVKPATRARVYLKIGERMASQAEAVFLYSKSTFIIGSKSVKGLTNQVAPIPWENVSIG